MKWINAEQQVTVTIYDEEHEEHLVKTMTVEEMLDTYANEGCPTIYSNPDRKKGKWIVVTRHEHYPSGKPYEQLQCPFCNRIDHNGDGNFCGYCGADMRGEEDETD